MTVEWRLQEALNAQGIWNACQLENALAETLGVRISRTALDKLLKNTPVHLRLETMQIVCNFLQKPLDAFLAITQEPIIRYPSLIQPYAPRLKALETGMIDPRQFF